MSTEWNKTTKHIVAVGMALFGLYLLYLSASVLKIFVIAALVAFLLMPVVTFLHIRLKMPQVLAILLSYFVLIVAILLAPLILLPPIIDGFNVIAGINYQALTENLFHWAEETLVTISQVQTSVLGFAVDLSSVAKPALEALRNTNLTKVIALPAFENIFTSVGSTLTLTLGIATSLAGSVVTGALALILILLYSIYFSLDANKLSPRFLRVVPEAYRPEIATLISRLSVTWRAYFRGQIILMFTVGTITLIGNSALGLPGAFSLAVIAGLLELIPNFGPFIAVVPAIVVALLQGSAYWEVNNFILALMVMGFYILVQQVENNFIVPRVLGGAVKLHPLVIMGGVVVGASVAGIAGALLAAPVIASGKEILSYLYAKILSQEPFAPTQATPKEEPISWPEQFQTLRTRWQRFVAQWLERRQPAKPDALKEPDATATATQADRATARALMVRPFERGIQETMGRYNRFVMPGLGFQIPFVHILRIRDIREHTMDIHPQPVITKDNVEIMVDGIMWVRPTADEEAIKRTFYNIDDWKRAIAQLAMTNLRQEFGDLTLDESLVARETIAANLQRILNTFAVEWGLTVSKVEIRLIDPPEDIKRAMHKQKTAEQERRSMRLLATGEFEATEQQKLAIIQRAEGEREAVIQVAQGKAEAIRLVNEAAEKYFVGNAQALKQLEMIENSLRENAKIVITEHGISPTLLLGSLPVSQCVTKREKRAQSSRGSRLSLSMIR